MKSHFYKPHIVLEPFIQGVVYVDGGINFNLSGELIVVLVVQMLPVT